MTCWSLSHRLIFILMHLTPAILSPSQDLRTRFFQDQTKMLRFLLTFKIHSIMDEALYQSLSEHEDSTMPVSKQRGVVVSTIGRCLICITTNSKRLPHTVQPFLPAASRQGGEPSAVGIMRRRSAPLNAVRLTHMYQRLRGVCRTPK